jgi:hypothetical protein
MTYMFVDPLWCAYTINVSQSVHYPRPPTRYSRQGEIVPKPHVSSASWSLDQFCIIPPITDEQVEAQLTAYAANNTNNTDNAYPADVAETTDDRDTIQYGGASLFNYMNWGGPQK